MNQLRRDPDVRLTLEEGFDIQSLFDAVRTLNALSDAAQAAGWGVDLCGADYVSVKVTKMIKGHAR